MPRPLDISIRLPRAACVAGMRIDPAALAVPVLPALGAALVGVTCCLPTGWHSAICQHWLHGCEVKVRTEMKHNRIRGRLGCIDSVFIHVVLDFCRDFASGCAGA